MGLLLLRLVSEACQTFTSAWVFMNTTGWLLQAATMLKITTQMITYKGHGFNCIL